MTNLQRKLTNPLIVEMSDCGGYFTLQSELVYYRKGSTNSAIIVPSGFKSDGFTNFGFGLIVSRYGRGLKCAILHDYLCDLARKGENTRKEADEIFLEAMLETKPFSKARIYLIYYAVRAYAKLKGLK